MVVLPAVRERVTIMLDWISSIGNSFTIIVQFISSFINGILSVFGLVGQCWAFLVVAFGVMPSVLLVFMVTGLTITIVFQLIGR